MLSITHSRGVLDALQGTDDGTPSRPRLRVEDWYRPYLINEDGVLCHAVESGGSFYPGLNYRGQYVPSSVPDQPPEMGGDTEGGAENGSRSFAVSMESLVYNDLMEGIEGAGMPWPNPAQAPDSGHSMSQTTDATDGLVFLSLHAAILSSYLRNWYHAFYDNFLKRISDLTGRSPA